MAGHISDPLFSDTQLVVAELVANSVRHADAPADAVITVRAEVRGDILRLEVADRGDGGSIARRTPDLHYGGGFGLHLVEVLSRRWGVNRGAGTRVWAELDFAATG
jgi:anti-sigma regulatory factor (Ser/Thr protein kinase)